MRRGSHRRPAWWALSDRPTVTRIRIPDTFDLGTAALCRGGALRSHAPVPRRTGRRHRRTSLPQPPLQPGHRHRAARIADRTNATCRSQPQRHATSSNQGFRAADQPRPSRRRQTRPRRSGRPSRGGQQRWPPPTPSTCPSPLRRVMEGATASDCGTIDCATEYGGSREPGREANGSLRLWWSPPSSLRICSKPPRGSPSRQLAYPVCGWASSPPSRQRTCPLTCGMRWRVTGRSAMRWTPSRSPMPSGASAVGSGRSNG